MQHSSSSLVGVPYSELTCRWLSCYYNCSQAEAEETHPTVVSRVILAIEAAKQLSSDSDTENTADSSPAIALNLTGLYMTTSEWSAALRSFVRVLRLRCLMLRDTNVGDAGLRTLSREMAAYGPTSTFHTEAEPSTSHAFTSSQGFQLEVLDLSGCGLYDASPVSLIVATCPRLFSLDLSSNHLGSSPTGLAVLCTALRLHARVETVDLSHNGIYGTRGGTVMAGLAELIVARSVHTVTGIAATAGSRAGGSVVAAHPLRALNLSYNLLGCYYLARGSSPDEAMLAELIKDYGKSNMHVMQQGETDGMSLFRDCVYKSGVRHLGGGRCNGGAGGCDEHEAVTAFPLVTALYLNNSILVLNLKSNGLPDALIEYVEAKLHVNRRTQQVLYGHDGGGKQFFHALSAERVKEVLHANLQRGLQKVYEKAASLKANVKIPDATKGNTASQSAEVGTSEAETAHWTAGDVQELLKSVVQSIDAELFLS